MPYMRFNDLSDAQKAEAVWLRPKWPHTQFPRMQFWVKPDGRLSRRNGHHTLTAEESAKIDAMLKGQDARTRGDLANYKVATFHIA